MIFVTFTNSTTYSTGFKGEDEEKIINYANANSCSYKDAVEALDYEGEINVYDGEYQRIVDDDMEIDEAYFEDDAEDE